MTPLYDTAEVRLIDPDFHEVLRRAATAVDDGRPVVIHFAAEGSAYDVTLVPFDGVVAARPNAGFPIARGATGPGGVYVVRDAWSRPGATWLNAHLHELEWVLEWCGTESVVDAVPFTILLNELEVARGRLHRTDWLRDAYRRWFDLARGADDDVAAHVLGWFAHEGGAAS